MSDPIIELLQYLAAEVPKHAAELSELDARLGDGDLGSTIELGFKSMAESLENLRGKSPSEQLIQSGMAFNRGGASTFGALIATALMQAGKTAANANLRQISARDVPTLGRAAIEAMMKRGKAKLGDKTMLDALAPAIEAFESATAGNLTPSAALKRAVEAAESAVQQTAQWQSRVSRAGWLAERSVGMPDPGAVAIVHILRSALTWASASRS